MRTRYYSPEVDKNNGSPNRVRNWQRYGNWWEDILDESAVQIEAWCLRATHYCLWGSLKTYEGVVFFFPGDKIHRFISSYRGSRAAHRFIEIRSGRNLMAKTKC